MRQAPGRAALRVTPGAQPALRRIIFSLLREVAQVKGGSILELSPDDWLLSEAPTADAEGLAALIGKLLPKDQVRLLVLPDSKTILADLLAANPALKILEFPVPDAVSPVGLEFKMAQINPDAVFLRRSYVSFNRAANPALRLQRLALNETSLRQQLGSYGQDHSLLKHARSEVQKGLLEALGSEGGRAALLGGSPAAPLLVDMPPSLLPTPPEHEEEPHEAASTTALYATLALDAAIGIENLGARRQALKRDAWGIAISGLSAEALSLVNMQALPADWVILEWSAELEQKTSLKLLGQLDPARVILDGCDRKAALLFGLNLGFSCYGGPWIEDLVTAARMKFCAEAARCTRADCRARGLATTPSGRIGCHAPHELEAVLQEAAA